jgi:hypothetical protein
MGESNGTNLKPILPILFYKTAYENQGVLVLRPNTWCERPQSTSAPHGWEVLMASTGT